jgi:hypothetical protein
MNVLRIALGDLKRVAKDWQASLWLLVMPLVFAYIFGSAMRGGGAQPTWIPVVNLDHHELADLFIDQLREEGYWIEVKGPDSQVELKQKWPYGVVIPAGFGAGPLQGKVIKLPLVKGEGSAERFLEVQSQLTHAIVRFTKGLVLADVSHRGWTDESRSARQNSLGRTDLTAAAGYARAAVTGSCAAARWLRSSMTARFLFATGSWTSVRARMIKWCRRRVAEERTSPRAAALQLRPARPSCAL